MKVRFILSFICLLLMTGGLFAENAAVDYSGKRVVLRGEIGTETGRSVTVVPIEATISEDYIINVVFVEAIGEVQILANGEVEQTCKVTTSGQETSISVADLAPGTYKLEFKTPSGGYVYGEFVIE